MGKKGGSGEVSVTTSNQRLPGKRINRVWFQAPKTNGGNLYVGWASATVMDGTTNTTTGWELDKTDTIGPISASNLDEFTVIGTDASDSLIYITD
jgi:hypothetical protein